MKKNEFEIDLEIDPNQLDVEAAKQGELFFKWAEKCVVAKKEVDNTKFRLEFLMAKIESKARTDPDAFGLKKITEASIAAAVKTSAEYLEAYEEWLSMKSNAALLDKAVEAMEQKKRMIESLITLHGQKYFAGPSVPRDLCSAWSNYKDDRSKKVIQKTKMRRRTKPEGSE